jgi:peptidoglycan/LPS O-acetylase OafA/YrhL
MVPYLPKDRRDVNHDVDADVSLRTSPKLLALDGIRGIAVLAVMACHYERFLPDGRWFAPVHQLLLSGWIGVDLFFVLSGFLITGILLRTRMTANYFSAFYMRRFLRIFPLYYAVLSLVLLLAAFRPDWHLRVPPSNEWIFYYLYVDNWLTLVHPDWPWTFIGHFWSLAIEEQFYLGWPLMVWLLGSGRSVGWVAAGGCVLALCVRLVAASMFGPLTIIAYTRFDALLAGAVGAVVVARYGDRIARFNLGRWSCVPLVVFYAGAAGLGRDAQFFVRTAGYTLLALCFAMLVSSAAVNVDAQSPQVRCLTYAPLRLVGRYSYGLYVYHIPVVGILEAIVFNRLPTRLQMNLGVDIAFVALLLAFTFAIARISYERFEAPILGLKRYFEPVTGNATPRPVVREGL